MITRSIILLLFLTISDSAKIGLFTAPLSNSQIVFMVRIAEVLVKGGHEVTMIRPSMNPDANYPVKNPKIKQINIDTGTEEYFRNFSVIEHKDIYETLPFAERSRMYDIYTKMVLKVCEAVVNNDEVMQQLRDEKFDLVFQHHLDYCNLGIFHELGVKKWVMAISSAPYKKHFESLGIPISTAIYPEILANRSNHMTFLERLENFAFDLYYTMVLPKKFLNPMTEVVQKKFPNTPPIYDMIYQPKLGFVNADRLVEFPVPSTAKLVYIGGIGTEQAHPLQEPFLSFVNNAKKVVLVSFGSVAVAADMPDSFKMAFIDLFNKNPDISFIWKFEEDIEVPKNVLRSKWIPQNDLLALDKTAAFITHGGYNSVGEIVSSGTPSVMVPLMADQYRNSRLAEYRGFGKTVKKADIATGALHTALTEVLTNETYKIAAKQLQKIIREKPLKPEQELLYWTNFVLENDYDMDLPQLNFFQYNCYDIIGFFALIVIVIILVIKKILSWYYWSCFEMAYKEKVKLQ